MTARFEPLSFQRLPADQMLARARDFFAEADRRRTTRHFSSDPVPRELIELAVRTAGTAPSGAHRQPWRFVLVGDPELKARMRAAAEAEEHDNYHGRMPPEWLEALRPLGTDEQKAHITDAPWVLVVFKQLYEILPDGARLKNYYVEESVGIATGLLIAALHHMGLVALTHTPSPMGFLASILKRPANERAYVLMPIGYPAPDAMIPVLRRRPLEELLSYDSSP